MQTLKKVPQSAIDKFVKENNGKIIDIAPGCLVDNVVYSFDFGTMFCFEQYLNEWSSSHVCYFFHKGRERGINKKWQEFYALQDDDEEGEIA